MTDPHRRGHPHERPHERSPDHTHEHPHEQPSEEPHDHPYDDAGHAASPDLTAWRHDHHFDAGNAAGQRGTRLVMWITAATMLVEIAAGWAFESMALLADGVHMSSHAVAIGLSTYAYAAARRHAGDTRFAFGTWKIEVLGGFASAVFLLVVAALMVFGSVERLWAPANIHYQEAVVVALLGLVINLVSARILGDAHDHGHGHDHAPGPEHGHDHADGHGHADGPGHAQGHAHPPEPGPASDPHHAAEQGQDLNLRSAYLHVVADAATSVLAIAALLGGWWWGWAWLDPVMGIVGAVVVALWARRLIADTAAVLLDREMDHPVVAAIRATVHQHAGPGDLHPVDVHSVNVPPVDVHPLDQNLVDLRLVDLHVWRVGRARYACAMTLVTTRPALGAQEVRRWLRVHAEVAHVTIEIHLAELPAQLDGATRAHVT